MNFSDLELKLRYPEIFRDRDMLTPPEGAVKPAKTDRSGVRPRTSRVVARFRTWLLT
ncbi:MAG: hypothetical protein KJO42_10585 [Silicimonas sp.]|nr:hypothetical protein [Silicimonas sp.]